MPDPPTLSTEAVHHMNKSDDVELTCRYPLVHVSGPSQTHTRRVFVLKFFSPLVRGRQYLRWSTPPMSTHFSISDCSGSGLFCTTLHISNATVNETGQYQCSYQDLKVEDGKTSAATYVFVNGVTLLPTEFSCFFHESKNVAAWLKCQFLKKMFSKPTTRLLSLETRQIISCCGSFL